MNLPDVIAHRGASGYAPENTFAAFDRSLALGFPDMELDVHVTSDGVPVVLHDANLERTTNGSGVVGSVPLATVRTLDAGAWFAAEYLGHAVPTLEDVLARYTGRARFTVEIKVPDAGLEAKTLGLLARYGMRGSSGICSFQTQVIAELEPVAGTMPVWLNVAALTQDAVIEALRLRASGIAAPISSVSNAVVEEAHERGLQVGAWTVDTEAHAVLAVACGLDRVYADRPDVVQAVLDRIQREVAGDVR